MNMALIPDGEFPEQAAQWLPDDAIPSTLESVIKLMFQDWGAQLQADADAVNAWLQANPDLAKGDLASDDGERKVHPKLGDISYVWRGTTVTRASAPHGLWHFERGASLARELQGDDKARFDALVQRAGGTGVMQIRLDRPLEREDDALVFG